MDNITILRFMVSVSIAWLMMALCQVASASTEEAEALLKWKQSLPKQQILQSWVFPGSPNNNSLAHAACQWKGIKCDATDSVIEINLAYTNLQGTLELLNFSSFPNLLRLDLKENLITGSIPENIGILSKLQFLDLSTNNLDGTLPLSLSNLTHVYELDVSRNKITGVLDPRLFPDDAKHPKTGLISINNLLFQDTLLGGRIPNEIGNIKGLTILALDGNTFYGPIPPTLGNCSNLRTLRFAENQLSGSIPPIIGSLKNLTELFLHTNKFSGPVPQEISNLSSLAVLYLGVNNFSGHLPQVCGSGKLVNFTAFNNNFTGPIPVSLKNCSSLYRVRLEYNQLTGYIDQAFGIHPNLTYIDISYNRVKGKLSPNWGACQNLQNLAMAGNMIVGPIPSEIFQINQLQKLDLSFNQLTGEIPSNMRSLSKLFSLKMDNNLLSGQIPSAIGELFQLQDLDFSMNNLSGTIPEQLGDCYNLRSLNLSKNHLNGSIPYQIGNLLTFQTLLDLSYNSLSGEIPAQLGKLTSLISLNLSHNNLSGLVPKSINDMLSLSEIDLSYNSLDGPLPDGNIFRSSQPESFSGNKNLCGQIRGLRSCNHPTSESTGGSKKHELIIIASLMSAVLTSLLLFIVSLLLLKKVTVCVCMKNYLSTEKNPFSIWNFDGKVVYEDILEATMNFDESYCIGEGASGRVYKAELSGGQVFAVKRLRTEDMDTDNMEWKHFKSEIATLTIIRHKNIVKLFGFCYQGTHKFLVYEFMERGSLADILSNDQEAIKLDWKKRVKIVQGVAEALSYIHHDCVPPIIHRDISSKNVLLSCNLEARISDFGTAKFLKLDSSGWTTFAGTYGYAAPELAYTMIATEKCDVYSFGVLAFEVLMGKHPGDIISRIQESSDESLNLHHLLDPRLSPPTGQGIVNELALVTNVALSCLRTSPQNRPTMRSITYQFGMELNFPPTKLPSESPTLPLSQTCV